MRRLSAPAILLAALATCALGGCRAADVGAVRRPIMPDPHPDVRARMLAHVGENLLPFWLEHCVDGECGGYLTELDREGAVYSGRKMLVTQARQIWAFSRLYRSGYRDPRVAEAARQGLAFLRRHFWDDVYEGWVWEVARDGRPVDRGKKTYAHAFVLYALVEYHRAFDDAEALALAERTMDVLERHAKDPENPGYVDFMDRAWVPDLEGDGHVKTMNTHLHLMEAFTELYLVTGKPLHRQRLREMLDILVEKCYLRDYGCCIDGFRYDWTPVRGGFFGERNRITSYGHNVEFAWLMQRAAQALGLPEGPYREIGLTLVEHALRYGWDDEAGALYYEGAWRGRPTNLAVEWWTQGENAVALDWAYGITGDARFLDALREQVAWILTRQADPVYGGWYSTLEADGTVRSGLKGSVWHGAYHEVRACLNVGAGRWD